MSAVDGANTITISKQIKTGGLCSTGTYTTELPCKVEFGGEARFMRMVPNNDKMEIQDIGAYLADLASDSPTYTVGPTVLYT